MTKEWKDWHCAMILYTTTASLYQTEVFMGHKHTFGKWEMPNYDGNGWNTWKERRVCTDEFCRVNEIRLIPSIQAQWIVALGIWGRANIGKREDLETMLFRKEWIQSIYDGE